MIGASAALHLSQIPFLQPTGAVRVGRVGGELVVMPTHSQLEESDLDLIVSGTRNAITMIEGFAREMPEDQMARGHPLRPTSTSSRSCDLIEELRDKAGLGAKALPPAAGRTRSIEEFRKQVRRRVPRAQADRRARPSAPPPSSELKEQHRRRVPARRTGEPKYTPEQVSAAFSALEERVVRDLILEGKRIDGRDTKHDPADQLRGRRAAADARLGPVPARRDAGPGDDHAGHRPATSSAWTA